MLKSKVLFQHILPMDQHGYQRAVFIHTLQTKHKRSPATTRWDYWLQDCLLIPKECTSPAAEALPWNTYFFLQWSPKGLHNTTKHYRHFGISLQQRKWQHRYLNQQHVSADKILIGSTNALPGSAESSLLQEGKTFRLNNLLKNTGQLKLTYHCYSKTKTSVWVWVDIFNFDSKNSRDGVSTVREGKIISLTHLDASVDTSLTLFMSIAKAAVGNCIF